MKTVFRWGVFVALILLVLPAAAIHAQDGGAPVAPPPANYAEVAEAFATLEAEVVPDCMAVVDLLLNGEYEAVYEQSSAELKPYIPPEEIKAALEPLLVTAPFGDRLDYRVLKAPNQRVYIALHAWGDSSVAIMVGLSDAGEINGLNLSPNMPLPDDPAAEYRSETVFRLPFDGLWFTYWGGLDVLHNYHVDAAPQRHAYDFVVWKDGSTYSGDGSASSDYYVYGQPVLAPADGVVVAMANDLPEVQPQIETDAEHPLGNHVVIQVAENEYLFMAHMQPGSILVNVNDEVRAGQQIGLVGNSGNTSEPHLHIHMQDLPDLFTTDATGQINGFTEAQGLPIYFSNYLANGEPVELGEPVGDEFVQNAS